MGAASVADHHPDRCDHPPGPQQPRQLPLLVVDEHAPRALQLPNVWHTVVNARRRSHRDASARSGALLIVVSGSADFGELPAKTNASGPSVILSRRQDNQRSSEERCAVLLNLDAVPVDLKQNGRRVRRGSPPGPTSAVPSRSMTVSRLQPCSWPIPRRRPVETPQQPIVSRRPPPSHRRWLTRTATPTPIPADSPRLMPVSNW